MRVLINLIAGCLASTQLLSGQEAEVTFKTKVHLVSVPVVVRDSKGVAVGNLEKADFQLFDKGKLQTISRFFVEKAPAPAPDTTPKKDTESASPPATTRVFPERFVAYLFDDVHLAFGDVVRVRDAARKNLAGLANSDRAAIFTTSGQLMLDFTDDRDAWYATLAKLVPRPMVGRSSIDCPNLNYHQANQIVNRTDTAALNAAVAETIVCANLGPRSRDAAIAVANAAARRVVVQSEHEVRVSLSVVRDVIKRMATTPGQRVIVMASPGFIAPEALRERTEIIERAIRAGIVINAIDARGLWVDPMLDASRPGFAAGIVQAKGQYERENVSLQADVLAEFTAGTGGTFFHNNNDVDAGFKRVAAAPEYTYILGFSPQDLKTDGSYHSLKVSLVNRPGLTALARKGYYAPKAVTNPEEAARTEIWEAIYTRQERNELPVTLARTLSRTGNRTTLAVQIDVKNFRFRKVDGVHTNILTVILGVFDGNGNLIRSLQKNLEMKLKDETLEEASKTGIVMTLDLELAPGGYFVRMVARDRESEQMSAQNGSMTLR